MQHNNNSVEVRAEQPGEYAVRGTLTFQTVPRALHQMAELADDEQRVCIDLSGVTRTDSAGLALLIEWMREARRHGREIAFRHVPEQLLAFARATSLDAVLPLES